MAAPTAALASPVNWRRRSVTASSLELNQRAAAKLN
jgi:hypothetical protein